MTTSDALRVLKHIGDSTYLDTEKEHALNLICPSIGQLNKLSKYEITHVLEWMVKTYIDKGDGSDRPKII